MDGCKSIALDHRIILASLVASTVILPEERTKAVPLDAFAEHIVELRTLGIRIEAAHDWDDLVPPSRKIIARGLKKVIAVPALLFLMDPQTDPVSFEEGYAIFSREAIVFARWTIEAYERDTILSSDVRQRLMDAARDVVNGFVTIA